MTSPFLTSREPTCPADLIERAAALPSPRVVIARAGSPLPMQAAFEATKAGLMTPIFTGEAADISREAAALNWDISQYQLIQTKGEEEAGQAAAALCGNRQADVLMKGQLHTDVFMKSALNRDAGLRTGRRLVHIFHVTHPDGGRPLLISDAAVNVAPNLETRQDAIRAVTTLLQQLGTARPKIAILSATESPIPSVPSAVEGRELSEWAAQNVPDADVSGPLALDLILSPDSVAVKGLTDDPVAGQADAVIVPDIVSGNTLFKALVYLSGGCAAGLVLGAKVPLLLTSRADPPAARLASVALAAIHCAGITPE
ncbi:phosphate acyltransferase [Pseudohalocynthiibacter aestuariivivens]|uniref:Phosphate acyltransferase n=1 Tax=Pseudohalocynthiibacter aestuariivivens TaxID=1591409 RepID=A0ABV5JKS3_9RHOB|nr:MULTISPECIES: phosphate acyltransferase [Pseudohalocynthiibacter]MBS9717381.1 phosphate acetyltransferase [Pseudohalocynthiibacter aestuariivivens]MCK0102285.1 phosphate acetyltransferase [Pseudohalocynthiibacter sp. F2068]